MIDTVSKLDVISITLTQDKVALIDASDWPLISGYTWHAALRGHSGRHWYAVTTVYTGKNQYRKLVPMHRLLLDPPDDIEIDHINGDGLDNRRSNLRLATRIQNAANSTYKKREGASSQFRGVTWNKRCAKWRASVGPKYLGQFDSELEAAHAYDKIA